MTDWTKNRALEGILADREKILTFLARRVEDRTTAEDLLQSCYLKAMEHAGEIREGESVAAWFYRILRNASIDHYRRRAARAKAHETFGAEMSETYEPEWASTLCGCLGGVLQGLKPEYQEAVQKVDLDEMSLEAFANERSLTTNNGTVRLHRARKALAKRLTAVCGACATHHCLDCTCRIAEV